MSKNSDEHSGNPYEPPQQNAAKVPSIGYVAALLVAWSLVLVHIGYALLGLVANGFEMARQFQPWRLREELHLAFMFGIGCLLFVILRESQRRKSSGRVIGVIILAIPFVAYMLFANRHHVQM